MDISVIIPVFNAENYLEACLNSVVRQKFTGDFEIICVNDGSVDSSGKILDQYANLQQITVIHQENAGPSAARNAGIKKSAGEYLYFIDSDDFLTSDDALQILFDKILGCNADVVMGNLSVGNENRILNRNYLNENKVYDGKEFLLLEKDYMFSVNKLYKKTLVETSGLYKVDLRTYEDCEFTPRVYYFAQKIIYLNQPIYHYRQHELSITHQKINLNDIFVLIFYLKDFAQIHSAKEVQSVLLNLIEILLFNNPNRLDVKKRNALLAQNRIYVEFLKIPTLKHVVFALFLMLRMPKLIEVSKVIKTNLNKVLNKS